LSAKRCGAGTAFDLLRQASQHRNRKLRVIAAEIVAKVSGQPPEPPRRFRV
jgi:AmiR/NasT family two-component response regulator